ncbi:TPA: DUF4376 domain-containing protein [Mannheimia haemolytica]
MTIKFDNEGFALTSGYILVHICDQNGIYTHSEGQFVSVGCGLATNAVLDAPLPAKPRFAVQRVSHKWQYVEDYRGKKVYSLKDKSSITVEKVGKVPEGYTLIEPFSDVCEWNGNKWEISPALQAVKKAEEIAMVRERINALRDSKSAGGVYVEQLGKWFDSDDKAQKKLLGLKATMDLIGTEMTVDWTCADNTDFEGFGKAHLTAVIAAILQAENHNHTVARQHKANLEQAENPLEYDYSAGWAKTYEDFLNEQTEKLSLS